MDKKALKNVATKLRKAADVKLRKDLRAWPEREDADMRKMFRGDHKDTYRVARLIERNKPEDAIDLMHDMDTSARDECGDMLEKNSKRFYNKYVEGED